jgi:hypothetical protein
MTRSWSQLRVSMLLQVSACRVSEVLQSLGALTSSRNACYDLTRNMRLGVHFHMCTRTYFGTHWAEPEAREPQQLAVCLPGEYLCILAKSGPPQDLFENIAPGLSQSTGIYYIIPPMSFSILVGLALDYDIFLVSRLLEFRKMVCCHCSHSIEGIRGNLHSQTVFYCTEILSVF